jgi:hypothetical protein
MNYSDGVRFTLHAVTRPPNPPSINIKTSGGRVGLLARRDTHSDLLRTPKTVLKNCVSPRKCSRVTASREVTASNLGHYTDYPLDGFGFFLRHT